jgi:hypothetical protein
LQLLSFLVVHYDSEDLQEVRQLFLRALHSPAMPRVAKASLNSTYELRHPLAAGPPLQLVLSYVGVGSWLFISTISKTCLQAYLEWLTAQHNDGDGPLQKTTLCRLAFASPTTLWWAHHLGKLRFETNEAVLFRAYRLRSVRGVGDWRPPSLQRIAGKYADVSTLQTAARFNLQLHDTELLKGAAESGCCAKLQWLRTSQQVAMSYDISYSAARSGSVDLLRWLARNKCVFDGKTMLNAARAQQPTAALQYLHSLQCPWEAESVYMAAATSASGAAALECLWQLREPTAALLTQVLSAAKSTNNAAAAQWARERGAVDTVVNEAVHDNEAL